MADTRTSIAYVSTQQLKELPAPLDTKGPIVWIKQNFFSNIRDSILTILSFAFLYMVISGLFPWMFQHAVLEADSLKGCRVINDDEGACFAVVNSRLQQLVFGFYPTESLWRPILTFIMMIAAFAPLLHDNLPRKMLWFSAAFPLLAFWMLWGGSIWMVLLLAAMVFGAYFFFRLVRGFLGATQSLLAVSAFLVIWLFFIQGPLTGVLSENVNFLSLAPVESSRFGGFLITFTIGVSGIVGSLPLGILLALGRNSDMPVVKMICVGFIEFIRGVPLITLLFVASTLFNYFLPPGTHFDLILRVIIMVMFFSAAYLAEVVRGGLAALPRGQYEAADALGLTYWQATQKIVLPQALKIAIPGIVGVFIGLFKDTTLVSIVGILDPVGMMQPIRSTTEWNGIVWELPIFIGAVFFIFCFTMSRYSMYFERKLDTGH